MDNLSDKFKNNPRVRTYVKATVNQKISEHAVEVQKWFIEQTTCRDAVVTAAIDDHLNKARIAIA